MNWNSNNSRVREKKALSAASADMTERIRSGIKDEFEAEALVVAILKATNNFVNAERALVNYYDLQFNAQKVFIVPNDGLPAMKDLLRIVGPNEEYKSEHPLYGKEKKFIFNIPQRADFSKAPNLRDSVQKELLADYEISIPILRHSQNGLRHININFARVKKEGAFTDEELGYCRDAQSVLLHSDLLTPFDISGRVEKIQFREDHTGNPSKEIKIQLKDNLEPKSIDEEQLKFLRKYFPITCSNSKLPEPITRFLNEHAAPANGYYRVLFKEHYDQCIDSEDPSQGRIALHFYRRLIKRLCRLHIVALDPPPPPVQSIVLGHHHLPQYKENIQKKHERVFKLLLDGRSVNDIIKITRYSASQVRRIRAKIFQENKVNSHMEFLRKFKS